MPKINTEFLRKRIKQIVKNNPRLSKLDVPTIVSGSDPKYSCFSTCCNCCGGGGGGTRYSLYGGTEYSLYGGTGYSLCGCTNVPASLSVSISGTCVAINNVYTVTTVDGTTWSYSITCDPVFCLTDITLTSCQIIISGQCSNTINTWTSTTALTTNGCDPFHLSGNGIIITATKTGCCNNETISVDVTY